MIAAVLLLSSLSAPSAAPRVAVMPARGASDVDEAAAQAAIRGAVAASTRVTVLEPDALTHLLASAAASGIACDASLAECAARVCAFGGLDFVVVTHLEGPRATLALNDCVDGREVRTAGALLGDTPTERKDGLAALAQAVLGEGEARGTLEVKAPAHGVVSVDGREIGAAPFTLVVAVGPHEVSWRPSSGQAATQTVEVPAQATARAWFAHLEARNDVVTGGDGDGESAAARGPAPAALSVAAGAAVIGAVGAVAGGASAWLVAPTDRARYTAREYNDAVTLGRVLLGVSVAGAVLAVVAGGALVLAAGDDAAPR